MKNLTHKEALELERALCRTNIADFTIKAFRTVSPADKYMHNWHVDVVAEYLHGVWDGDITRLVINLPPRHLKSIETTVAFPAWALGKDPTTRIIAASFVDRLALKHSVDTRLIIEADWYRETFPNTVLADDQNEKGKFQTTKRGHRIATSVGANITGEGADIIIVDDPLNPMEALSEKVREDANTWFDQTLISRLNNPKTGRIIIVMQRLHERDLTGHVLEKGGYEHLKLPLVAERKTMVEIGGKRYTRDSGDILHEERMDRPTIERLQNELGPYAFAGQYQQSPVPLGGGEIKVDWLQQYDPDPEKFSVKGMNLYILVDAANEKKKTSDYTAMIVWALGDDRNYYLVDAVRDRLNPTERINTLISLHRKWAALSGNPPIVGYEKYGMMTDTFYLKHEQDRRNYRFPVIELGGSQNKNDRIRRIIPPMQRKTIYAPHTLLYKTAEGKVVDLRPELLKEMSSFPVAPHDDMMDAATRIFDEGMNIMFPDPPTEKVLVAGYSEPREEKDWFDA